MKPFSACVFVALLGYYQCEANPAGLSKWSEFKAKHGKQHTGDEDLVRMQRFLERDADIAEHNAKYARGEVSFSRGHSQYSDMSTEEVKRFALGFNAPQNLSSIPYAEAMPSAPMATNFDWRSSGVVTNAKDQKNCGSCYAFAATGLIESFLLRKGQGAIDAAEQDAVDCSIQKYYDQLAGWQNMGCQGGWPTSVLKFYIETGILYEQSYRYTSGDSQREGACRKNGANLSIAGAQIKHVRVRSENEMVQLLNQNGPLLTGMAADMEHKKYIIDLREGIFDQDNTINLNQNHAVVIVGYGNENGKDYWVIKNSWGTQWGVNGFGKIRRGKNMCNIMAGGVWYLQ